MAGTSGVGGSSAAAAAAAAAARRAAEAARRAAEAARRRAEEARQRAEQARQQAAAARKQQAEAQKAAATAKSAAQQAKTPPADKPKPPPAQVEKAQKAADTAKAHLDKANAKLQDAETKVVAAAKEAEKSMLEANAAAKAEKKPQPYGAKELGDTGVKASEVKKAFDGASAAQRAQVSKTVGVDAGADLKQIEAGLQASRQYDRLAAKPGTQKMLQELDIRSGQELQQFGEQLARAARGGGAGADDIDLEGLAGKKAFNEVVQGAAKTLKSEDARLVEQQAQAMKDPVAAELINKGVDAEKATEQAKNIGSLGLKPEQLKKLTGQDNLVEAAEQLSKLGSQGSTVAEKIDAAVALGNKAEALVPQDLLEGAAAKAFTGLKNAKDAVGAIRTLTDPDATGVQKGEAGLKLANQLKEVAGALSPDVAKKLGSLDGPLKVAGAALTLVNPDASVKDKAIAAAEMAGGLADLKGDLSKLKGVFERAGVKEAGEVTQQGTDLASLAAKGVDPEKAAQWPPDQLKQMTELAKKTEGDALGKLVTNVETPEELNKLAGDLNKLPPSEVKNAVAALGDLDAKVLNQTLKDPKQTTELVGLAGKLEGDAAKNLGKALTGLDPKGTEALLKVAKEMGPDELGKVLSDSGAAEGLGKTLAKLDPKNVDELAKMAKDMGSGGLKLISKFGSVADAGVVNGGLADIAKVFDKLPMKGVLGDALGALDGLLGKMGVKYTAELAGKLFKNVAKVIPVAGAAISAYDTGRLALESEKLKDQNPDLSMFAFIGAGVNGLDTATAALNVIPGLGTAAEAAIGVGLGVAELAIDLGLDSEKAKMEQEGDSYDAPDWMKAVNIAGTVAMGPAGVARFVDTYGISGTKDMAMWAIGKGGDMAKAAWDLVKNATGPLGEFALEAVEKFKDLGEAGVDALKYVATSPGRIGAAAAEAAVEGLKDLGEAGVEALKDVASSGAEVAKKAAEGLKNLAEDGVDAAKDALEGLKDIGGEIGDFAGDALGALGDLVDKATPW